MAAAYAALMSLTHTSKLILDPSQQRLRINRIQIESLLQKIGFLQEFLEDFSHRGHEEMAGLERQIADVAYAAENIIEFHVLDQILARSTSSEAESSTSFSEYIQNLIKEMEDLIETEVMRIKETIGDSEEDRTFVDFSPAVSTRLAPSDQNTLVGSEEKLIEIMDRLTGQQSSRQIIAICGMAGIGKTTLARNVYDKPYVVHHFHVRAWVTISHNYSVQKIILALLSEIFQSEQDPALSDDQLGEKLYKSLYGRTYLIVMDDLWGTMAWDEIRVFLPNNCNGSRIMITTRLLNVATKLSSCRPFQMEFLDDDQSWKLLRYKVFGRESVPNELEELGKNIAIKCRGLPLAIVVIGGLLAKSNKTREFWEYVAGNLNSIINSGDDENCLKILYLSYRNLPIYLKPCFLYMVVVPEGSGFSIGDLTKLWVAEGFLKPLRAKSLEEVAYEYITDLIDRNLIFVRSRGTLGRLKTCGMHDLLRDLCLRETQKENFLSVLDNCNPDILGGTNFKHRLCFRTAPMKFALSDTRFLGLLDKVDDLFGPQPVRSSYSVDDLSEPELEEPNVRLFDVLSEPELQASNVRLLRVLDVLVEKFPPIYMKTMQLVSLRWMSVMGKWNNQRWRSTWMTSSISICWRLQTLKFSNGSKEPIFLPPEIWGLPQLRHLRCNRVVLPDPPCSDNIRQNSFILKNLQTLSTVLNFRCAWEDLERVPNLKKLKVTYDHLSPEVHQWWSICDSPFLLQKLESLKFNSTDPITSGCLRFPRSLKVLKLSGCGLPWEKMLIVGSLRNLEELVLWSYAFKGLEWCPVEGQFVSLKLLVIGKTDLLYWKADKTHFPILEHLVLHDRDLKEIPQDLGELLTLKKIEVFSCSDSTVTLAMQVHEELENLGNEYLQVIIK